MAGKLTGKVLVVDDEVEIGRFFEEFLGEENGLKVTTASSGREAREKMKEGGFDLAFLDLKLPDATGIELLEELRARAPQCRAVIMTGHSTTRSAVQAIRLGAFDYVEKPFDELEELERIVNSALQPRGEGGARGGKSVALAENFNMVCAQESPLLAVLEVAAKIAKKNLTVLIFGPTGAGKEVLARFIHANSQRAEKPFISVNCGAFSETLLESELFGHEKGAFTGASNQRRGIFEIANGGTLFLDEIGESTPAIQVKLLRTLETGEFMRVGGERHLRTDIRIIAATNVDLRQAVERGAFRRDLFYRLDVVSLEVPPLRERQADLDVLLRHFIDKFLPDEEKGSVTVTPGAMAALRGYDWPGNVREFANVMARAVALREGQTLDCDALPSKIRDREGVVGPLTARPVTHSPTVEEALSALGEALFSKAVGDGRGDFAAILVNLKEWDDKVVRDLIRRSVDHAGGRQAAAARLLGCNPRMVRYYLRERRKSQ